MANDYPSITSLQNPHLKAAAKLRTRKGRKQANQIIIDGWREVSRAINSGLSLLELFATPSWLTNASDDQLKLVQESDAICFETSRAVFEKIAYGERNEGIVAVAKTPTTSLNNIQLSTTPLIAVVQGIEKPGNLGAIVRSADGAGFDAVVVVDIVTDIYNPNAIRASVGTIFSLPVVHVRSERALRWLADNRISIFAARVDGQERYSDADFTGPTAIAVGSETEGLSPEWMADSISPIRLPMLGAADSLNVSATSAILFYEARRQRDL